MNWSDTTVPAADYSILDDKPTGWNRALRAEPNGNINLDGRDVPIRAKHVRSKSAREAVSQAYAENYVTKASQKWVEGLAEPHRAGTTMELVPV